MTPSTIKNLTDLSIKIIDFGSTTFDHEYHTKIINTRQYRAPEVILGCGWGNKSDNWGIACIIMELFTGELFYKTHESYEHLAMIEKQAGSIPKCMIEKATIMKNRFRLDDQFYQKYETFFDWPRNSMSRSSEKRVKHIRHIKDIFRQDHLELQDILFKLMEINPKKRYTCKEALEHPFFKVKY